MFKQYQVIGLQRTGTNWINELIKLNFKVKPIHNSFWKHLTPLGIKYRRGHFLHWKTSVDDLVLKDDVFYIATSKEFNLWKQSLKRNAEDFTITHKGVIRNNPQSTQRIYDAWHNWKNEQIENPNFFYKDYMDWLHNWESYLNEIHIKTGWEKTHNQFINITKPAFRSPDFKIENYIIRNDDV